MKKVQFAVKETKHFACEAAYIFQKGMAEQGYKRIYAPCDIRNHCAQIQPDIVMVEDPILWHPDALDPENGFTGWKWAGNQGDQFLRTCTFGDPWKGHREAGEWGYRWEEEFAPHVTILRFSVDYCCDSYGYDRDRVVRMYHTITPEYHREIVEQGRKNQCLLSGCAKKKHYPVRARIWGEAKNPRYTGVFKIKPHHNWERQCGTVVPEYIETLRQHKVMFVGTSKHHAGFKKHIEATAAGCIVISNLPEDRPLPWIDSNIVRVGDNVTITELVEMTRELCDSWNVERQREMARIARQYYSYERESHRIDTILKNRYTQLKQGESR